MHQTTCKHTSLIKRGAEHVQMRGFDKVQYNIPLATLNSESHVLLGLAQCIMLGIDFANMEPLTLLAPLTREGYENLMFWWQFFPIVRWPCHRSFKSLLTSIDTQFTAYQWVSDIYPAGKTSIASRFNTNTKISWAFVEQWAMIIMWYLILTLPAQNNLSGPLPWQNYLMAWLYVRSPGRRGSPLL